MVEGLTCYAAPIKNHFGEVIAAVSTSGATTRMVKSEKQVVENLFQTASDITNTFSKVPQSTVSTKV
jgi:DNA-binding IclR family transcriptional regulator